LQDKGKKTVTGDTSIRSKQRSHKTTSSGSCEKLHSNSSQLVQLMHAHVYNVGNYKCKCNGQQSRDSNKLE